jgi:hypothetical protein
VDARDRATEPGRRKTAYARNPVWSNLKRSLANLVKQDIAGAGPLLAAAGALIGQVRGYGRGA